MQRVACLHLIEQQFVKAFLQLQRKNVVANGNIDVYKIIQLYGLAENHSL